MNCPKCGSSNVLVLFTSVECRDCQGPPKGWVWLTPNEVEHLKCPGGRLYLIVYLTKEAAQEDALQHCRGPVYYYAVHYTQLHPKDRSALLVSDAEKAKQINSVDYRAWLVRPDCL